MAALLKKGWLEDEGGGGMGAGITRLMLDELVRVYGRGPAVPGWVRSGVEEAEEGLVGKKLDCVGGAVVGYGCE